MGVLVNAGNGKDNPFGNVGRMVTNTFENIWPPLTDQPLAPLFPHPRGSGESNPAWIDQTAGQRCRRNPQPTVQDLKSRRTKASTLSVTI